MRKIYLFLFLCVLGHMAIGQGINPTAEGGFETGSTFASNGWTVVNSGTNTWELSAVAGQYAGSRSAFISNSGGSGYFYDHELTGQFHTSHLYKDVVIPAGATGLNLSWYMKGNGEVGWDRVFVSTAPTSVTPVANVPVTNSIAISGATAVFTQSSFLGSYALQSVTLPNSLAGTTVRIIFSWQNDDNTGTDAPASVDNISLTYTAPASGFVAAPATLPFGGLTVGSNSIQMFTLSASALAGFPGNVTVTAPSADFQVSLEGSIWMSSITFPFTSSVLSPQSVFVRYNANTSGPASGNITVSGGGGTPLNVPVTGTGAAACSAAPTAGTAAVTPASGNTNTVFALSLSGTTATGGLSYQWQISNTGLAGSFTNIPGATTLVYSYSGIYGARFFQCVVTCPSFAASTSSIVSVAFTPPALPAASCTPNSGTGPTGASGACSSYGMWFYAFSVTGASGSISDGLGCNGSGYLDRTSLSCAFNPGSSYSASVTTGNGNAVYCQIWIDFNGDGAFTSGESIGGMSSTFLNTVSVALTIPSSVTPGTYRMRAVQVWSGDGVPYPSINPCMNGYNYGEARDYTVTIAPACATPPAITGTNFMCLPGTTTLSNATSGGTWAISNTAVATISGGTVTGVAPGAATVTYTAPGGCRTVRALGTYAKPTVASVAASPTTLCATNPLALNAGATVGTLSSYNWSGPAGYSTTTSVNNASLTPLTSAASGTYNLTVTSNAGCVSSPVSTAAVTVNNTPAPITGANAVCEGANTTLTTTSTGGTWTSCSAAASIGASTGVVTGGSAGIGCVSYTFATGCAVSYAISVNPLPVVSVSPSSSATRCLGESASFTASSPNPTFSLMSQNFNSGITGWTITNGAGTAANWWQVVTPGGSTAGISGDGTLMMQAAPFFSLTSTTLTSPSFSTAGYGAVTVAFNQYLISDASDAAVAIEYSVNGGSTWTPWVNQANSVVGSGAWTAASPEFSMALPAGALGQADVKLRWRYSSGSFYWYIDNVNVTATLPASTFAWTGAPGLSCTTCTNPDITPTSTGLNAYSVAVTSSAGCVTTNGVTVSVNPLPGAITGNLNVCVGTTFTLGNSAVSGIWQAENGNVTIGAVTGAMTGNVVGTSTITYTLPTGCKITAIATVTATPSAILGTAAVCEGLQTTLGHSVPGGTWVSTTTGVGTINSFGVFSGIAAGNSVITYTVPSGCIVMRTATVNATPQPITGPAVVCKDMTTTVATASTGGVWSSGLTSVATINSSGVITGMGDGFSIISYTIPSTDCRSTRTATVNPLPAPIMGTFQICQGGSTVLTDATAGGTWSSNFPTVATINASGLVTAPGPNGNAVIEYVLTATGCKVNQAFTVNQLPTNLIGVMEVCKDDMTALSSSPSGGTWLSSNTTNLTIDPSTGVATGQHDGTANVTYTLSTGCRKSATVTVNPLPEEITGTKVVCVGQTTTLYDFTPGGMWISGNPVIADISSTGVVTGNADGLVQITYSLTTGCIRTTTVTVNALPGDITGNFQVCQGLTTALGSPDFGGTWSTSNSTIAAVNAMSGVVTGGTTAGNANITYTLGTGCRKVQNVTVNALPAVITGPLSVCELQTIQLTNASAGGTWDAETPGTASVNSTGVVTGNAAGMTIISYTLPTTCMRTRSVVVNMTPASIMGNTQVCLGQSSTLSSVTAGGVWSSQSSVIAPVNSMGTVTGANAGNTNITYTLPTGGCRTTTPFVVNPLPQPITGPTKVCAGANITLATATMSGTWESGTGFVASIDMNTGFVTGNNAGTSVITFTEIPTMCTRMVTITVNPLPAPVLGVLNVCTGLTTQLTNATPGGTWSSSVTGIATINSSGLLIGVSPTGGVSNIHYTLPTTCRSTASVVVNPLPQNITGTTTMCMGQSTTLSNGTFGGNWIPGDAGIASVNASGEVYGAAAGSTTISYVLPTTCQKTISVVVNALPAAIAGNTNICQGTTTILGNSSVGGTWSSQNPAVAPIGLNSGAAIGNSVGFSIITYTLPTGCYNTTSLIVNDLPDAITGSPVVCAGSTTQLENATPGGVWSSATSVAMIDASGLVTGIAAGTSRVTYTMGNNCRRITVVSVNPLPGLIVGNPSACFGQTTVLSNAFPGGVWTSDNSATASVDASSGIVSGDGEGSANITYTLPTGCMRSKAVAVQAPIAAITGTMSVCKGMTTTLSNVTAGGVWISDNTTIATIGVTTGEVTGIAAGAALVSYAMPTGCVVTGTVVVNPLPANITGAMNVCEGSLATLSNATGGGSWESSDDAIAMVDAGGVVSGVASGSVMITYSLPTGCMATKDIAVNALPEVANVTGGGSYCSGGAGVAIGLDGSEAGVMYVLHHGASSWTMTSTGGTLSFGNRTAAGLYTAEAITIAGCTRSMAGDAMINVTTLVMPSVSVSSDMGDSVCAGTSTTFTATGMNGGLTPGYTWSVGSTAVGTGSTYTYTPANGDVVSINYMSSAACPSVASVNASMGMTVIAKLTPAVSISVAPDDTVCQGSTAAFYASSMNGGDAPVYTWIVGGTPVAGVTGNVYSYIPTNGQSVICRLNSNYRCPVVNNVSSNAVNMRVEPKYIPVVSIVAQPGTVVSKGQSVSFTTSVSGGGPAPRYHWLINQSPVGGATTPTFTHNDFEDGDSVTCIVYGTGECGMATINSVVMKITEATGVVHSSLSNSDIKLMPNPNRGEFTVSGTLGSSVDGAVSMQITDMLGQVVYSSTTTAKNGVLNERVQLTNTLANGMYMLNLSSGSDRKVFHFVLKQ